MSNRKSIKQHLVFWGVVLLAVSAEGWMDLICRVIY